LLGVVDRRVHIEGDAVAAGGVDRVDPLQLTVPVPAVPVADVLSAADRGRGSIRLPSLS
jgi:hypothetical protein